MNTSRLIVSLCVVVVALCAACGGDGSPSSNTPTSPTPSSPTSAVRGTFTARIDGESFSGTRLALAVIDTLTVVIEGRDRQLNQFNIMVPPRVGTYNVRSDPQAYASYATNVASPGVWNASTIQPLSSGTITITALRPRTTGTFQFVLQQANGIAPATRQVVDGRFDIEPCSPPCTFDPL